MPEKWTGEVIAIMHVNRITYDVLAKKLGVTKGYISQILNGYRNPSGAENRFRAAVDELVKEKSQSA